MLDNSWSNYRDDNIPIFEIAPHVDVDATNHRRLEFDATLAAGITQPRVKSIFASMSLADRTNPGPYP